MGTMMLTKTSLALGLILLGAACSSSSEDPSGNDPTAPPTASPTGAPTTPPAVPTGTGTTTPPGPTLTGVRIHYAAAPSVPASGAMTLRGSTGPLSWDKSIPVTATKPGLYTWQIPDAKTDIELKPMLGSAWSRGPNYKVKAGQTIDIYPHFVVGQGTVTKKYPSFVSQKLPSTRGLWVYLPAAYIENTEARFGVLYMHDGSNLFDASLAFGGNEWKVDETMDAGAEDGSIRETIVVGIESTANRLTELTPPTGKADLYVAMMIDEIKPMIDKDLRTIPAREQTAIMGSSLGGLASAYAGVHRADVFGLVGEMSPSTWWDGTMILGEVSSTPTRPAKPIRVYVDSGDSGTSNDDVVNTTELAARYRAVGYKDAKDFLHVVQPGGQHNEFYWAQRLPKALSFLLGARPN
jgi:predicted alpha/beta superfamily hydrolase